MGTALDNAVVRLVLIVPTRNAAFNADALFWGHCDPTLAHVNNPSRGSISMRKSVTSLVAWTLLSSTVLVHADTSDPATVGDSPAAAAAAATGSQTIGTVEFTGGSIAAGVGFSWGHGTLNFGGQSHALKISGVSLVDVGAASISASGTVYNLRNLADFNGNYVAMTAGMTVAGGGSGAYLKNEHGVVIKLHSTETGLRFNLAADGLKVALAG
jgi:hypothetical protein